MKRVIFAGFIATLALSFGQASALPTTVAGCDSTTDAASNGSCSATFDLLEGGHFVSILGTYANFTGLGESGTLTLTWTDAEENLVAEFSCVGLGLGGLDAVSVLCSEVTINANYVIGTQTLTVEALSDNPDQPFHASLALSPEGELI